MGKLIVKVQVQVTTDTGRYLINHATKPTVLVYDRHRARVFEGPDLAIWDRMVKDDFVKAFYYAEWDGKRFTLGEPALMQTW